MSISLKKHKKIKTQSVCKEKVDSSSDCSVWRNFFESPFRWFFGPFTKMLDKGTDDSTQVLIF